jgi:hypothetical protein
MPSSLLRVARPALLAGLLSGVLAACAAKPTITCGTGTSEENGVCVPVAVAKCKDGQALVGGTCRPVCGNGTIYVGTVCTVAEAACGDGTTLVGGQCVASDPLAGATVREGAEPNDTAATATPIELPAIGQAAVVVGGIVGAPIDGRADFDGYVFTANAGDLVRVQLTAVGASSVGAVLEPIGLGGSLRRYVVDPAGRGATRDVYLPVGGAWLLKVGDATNLDLFQGEFPRGGSDASYLAALSLVTPPSTRSLTVGATETGDWKTTAVFALNGDVEAQLVNVGVRAGEGADALAGLRSVWMTDASGKFLGEETDKPGLPASEALLARFAVPPAGARLGIDTLVDFGGAAGAAWSVSVDELSWTAVDVPYGGVGDLSDGTAFILGFDVAEAGIVRIGVANIGYDLSQLTVELRDAAFRLKGSSAFATDGTLSGYVPAGAGGRHYAVFRDAGWVAGEGGSVNTFDWDVSQQPVTSLALADVPGMVVFDQTLPDEAEGWYVIESPVDAELTAMLSPDLPDTYLALDAFDARMTPLTPAGVLDVVAMLDGLAVSAGAPVILKLTATQSAAVTGSVDVYVPFTASESEPNDQVDQGQSLPLEASRAVVVNAAIDVRDADAYAFTLTAPATVRLLTRKVGTTSLDTKISLYDEVGFIDENDDIDFMAGNFYSRIERDLAPGTYVVRVETVSYAFGDVSSSGPYQLSLRTTPLEVPAP